MPELTQRASLGLGIVMISSGVIVLLPSTLRSGSLLVVTGGLFVLAGLRKSIDLGPSSVRWWQLDGIGLVVFTCFAWAYAIERGSVETSAPMASLTAFLLVITSVVLLATALDLVAGGKYIFPDQLADA